ncbi:MAG TPA: hypothetical protein VJ673_00810 [Aromatoleum sp.]|uniref:hypothetical protein n=1 Tax=Aromatoleum sp. TaxID=2307007 RepID=UPI002B466952|nr:hypothetical protein [Aromatoleum sp.]HJV24186.1 hypothetical protein [Aromatoleum sp.]
MHELRVLVLECDGYEVTGLTGHLRELGVEHVQVVEGREAPMMERLPERADVVFCGLDGGGSRTAHILHRIADQAQPAAVVIYGPLEDPAHAENVCRRLGLRYLGHLPEPMQPERLRRLVRQVRTVLCR